MPANIHLSTTSGTIERRNGYVAQTLHVFADTLGQETVTVSTVDDVRAAVQAFGASIRAKRPASSFLVSIMMQRGNRKPNGYDKAYLGNVFGQEDFLRTVEEQTAATARQSVSSATVSAATATASASAA